MNKLTIFTVFALTLIVMHMLVESTEAAGAEPSADAGINVWLIYI